MIKKLLLCCFSLLLIILIGNSFQVSAGPKATVSVGVSTAPITPQCASALSRKSVKLWDLPNLSAFLPVIPTACAVNGSDVQPLGISAIPDILIRVVGLMFSLSFYLMPGAFILLGFNLALKPFDPSINKNQFQEITTLGRLITKQIGGIVFGIVLIIFSYTIVFTILRLFNFQGDYTDLSNFFG